MIILGAYSNSHVNDKQEFIPAINAASEELLVKISMTVADAGYFGETKVTDCERKDIIPIISISKEKHNSFLNVALTKEPDDAQCITSTEKMHQKLKSAEGKVIYKKRKQTVEPVFGISKEILGFRRFSLRGETDAEWSFVCSTYILILNGSSSSQWHKYRHKYFFEVKGSVSEHQIQIIFRRKCKIELKKQSRIKTTFK